MQVGYLIVNQNVHEGMSDADFVKKEMALAEITEQCGFDICWSAEHHFDDYSIVPDNLQTLTWLAARTSRIKLGTGAVILPWNEPIRVAEKLCMLDALCDGRLVFGIGRGLIIVLFVVFISSVFVSQTEQWQQSVLMPYALVAIEWSRIFINDMNSINLGQ